MFPGILCRLALKEAHLRSGRPVQGPAGNPLWLKMLTAPELGGAHTNFLATLERCSVVRDAQAQHVAHTVTVMCQDSGVPDWASAVPTKATTTNALLGGSQVHLAVHTGLTTSRGAPEYALDQRGLGGAVRLHAC